MTTLIEKVKEIISIIWTIPDSRPISVGGSVRDAVIKKLDEPDLDVTFTKLFENSCKDYDLEIFGANPDEVLIALTNAKEPVEVELVGRSFPVYKVKGYAIDISFPRLETKVGEKHTDFDIVTDSNMSFEKACLRRDFTCNAIGYDWNTGRLLDPFRGINDITNKIIRPVSEKFKEDSLRVLRCFKFIGRLGFIPDETTINYCKEMVPSLANYARERVLPEWNDFILKAEPENIYEAMMFLIHTEASKLYPEVFDMISINQDDKHHPEGDVFCHSMHCLGYFAREIRPKLANDSERLIVGYAVLTHDMGKITETKVVDGKIQAHGHEDSPLPRRFLEKLFDVNDYRINEIEQLVKAHMRPVILHKANAGMSAIRRLNLAVNGRIDRLMAVVESDQGGRPPIPVNTVAINWVLDKFKELELSTTNVIKPIIMGRHLIKYLNMKPSPEFGPIIDTTFNAQLDGLFTDELTGIEYLKAHYKIKN